MTFEELSKLVPFEGSVYERYAEEVYAEGLHCRGDQAYQSLDDALDDWRAEYEQDVRDCVRDSAGLPDADARLEMAWARHLSPRR